MARINKDQLDTTLVDTTSTQTITGKNIAGTQITGTVPNATTVTTNANLTGDVTSVGNATTYNNALPITKGGTGATSKTGTGANVLDTSAALSFPTLTSAVIAPGGLSYSGSTSGSTTLQPNATATGTLTLPATTDTLVGKSTTDTLTNKTFDTAGTGNSLSINGVAATANTGTGAVARAAGPTFTTPTLGAASATSVNGLTITSSTGTLTVVNAGTLATAGAFSQTHTVTAATNATYPAGTITLQDLSTAQTVTGAKSFNSGTLKLNGSTSGTSTVNAAAVAGTTTFTLPGTSDTLAGIAATQALTNKTITDSTNSVSSATLTNPYKFSAYNSAAQNVTSSPTKILYNSEEFDTGNNFDSTTNNRFTAPVAGFYQFNARVDFNSTLGVLMLYKNGLEFKRGNDLRYTGVTGVTLSVMVKAAAGDTFEIYAQAGGTVAMATGAGFNYFQGFLISLT